MNTAHDHSRSPEAIDQQADTWLADLTVDEKVLLLSGASTWRSAPVERLGIPAIKMSDGPNGVRGEHSGNGRTPAIAVPTGIVMGATWDPELVGRVADLLAVETLRRSSHVLLAPAVNLHRTPVGGRTFEYFSEDPELTARLAVATVQAIQAHDVGVTVKHFIANDTEIDRHTVDVNVDERVLRELYLRPFEACMSEAEPWGVMSAYNQLAGEFCGANHRLLRQILRDEWGFDGFVVSDWFGAHDSVASIKGGLSLEMPGPARVHGALLTEALTNGEVTEADLDPLVRDILVLALRTRADERSADTPEVTVDDPAERALAREVAAAGTVLVRNDGTLPLKPQAGQTVAVIGPNAEFTRIMGGGSSAVRPLPYSSMLDALATRFDSVVYKTGWDIERFTRLPRADQLLGPDGEPGLDVAFYNGTEASGEATHTDRFDSTRLLYLGSVPDGVDTRSATIAIRGQFIPRLSGTHTVGLVVTNPTDAVVGGQRVLGYGDVLEKGQAFYQNGSTEQQIVLELTAGEPVEIQIDMPFTRAFCGVRLGINEPVPTDQFESALAAAIAADSVIIVAGTNEDHESEGHDRTTIQLPGRQDEFITAAAAACDQVVVVVNAGAPVSMPWLDDVNAVLVPFFGGIEMSEAVADIITGVTDPGGRLPLTYPKALEDCPAWPSYLPVDGVQTYGEGFAMGYRGHDMTGVEPLIPFGHGLSYGTATWGEATVETSLAPEQAGGAAPEPGTIIVTQPVTATGDRAATVVVQGYVAPIDAPVEREPKALKTWSKVVIEPGQTVDVRLEFGAEAFRRWSVETNGWTIDPGRYQLLLGASAADIRSKLEVGIA